MTEPHAQHIRIRGDWLNAEPLRRVFAALTAGKAETRVIGGAVRDALYGRPVREVDLATTAIPDEVIRLARAAGLGTHPTGLAHGTVTLVSNGHTFEVTTLRRDVETDGRHAVVAFTTSWSEDADRRDFTINALSCSENGTLFDTVGGVDDIRHRRVRFIGDAKTRIREDYLRILRFFRFSAGYSEGQLDPTGLAAVTALKDGLSGLAAERIRSELMKLLTARHAPEVVAAMNEAGILPLLVRTNIAPQRLTRLASIETALGRRADPITRLAALAVSTPEDAAILGRDLRLSNAETDALEVIAIAVPEIDPAAPDATARAQLYKLGPEAFSRAVIAAWARSEASVTDNAWRRRALLADRWKAPQMPFSGADVLALGTAPGPAVGRILDAFERWWMAADFPQCKTTLRAKLAALTAEQLG
ncbi:CCA tRNA nucleotidyltransferase [Hyphomicrobium methylovorum]|uniref:CCA tRNA nucleotidyltransferase n=1 Tax=Hyphomicrobium methylovorum TaxID=84 RepID=UPI0015E76463|nr:CCA tRNA nucleotidyltransferase [Hyphomicrobium methylovorum]MBA2126908.1 CCA tRNA nucleotidyltransferase [Hyphomicrobium methylovorum]